MGLDHSWGVRPGFNRSASLVFGPQKLYLRKLRVLRSYSLDGRQPIITDETVHYRIVKTGVSNEKVNDASQIEISASKHAIEAAVKSAIAADDAL
jgi:hypothetical protein